MIGRRCHEQPLPLYHHCEARENTSLENKRTRPLSHGIVSGFVTLNINLCLPVFGSFGKAGFEWPEYYLCILL